MGALGPIPIVWLVALAIACVLLFVRVIWHPQELETLLPTAFNSILIACAGGVYLLSWIFHWAGWPGINVLVIISVILFVMGFLGLVLEILADAGSRVFEGGFLALVVAATLALLGIGLFGQFHGSKSGIPVSAAAQVVATATETATPSQCDTGSEDWVLQDLHGDGNKLVNTGIKSIDDLKTAAQHDPVVLRVTYIGLKAASDAKDENIDPRIAAARLEDSLPTVKQLNCVEDRKTLWDKMDGIISVSHVDTTTMGDLAGSAGLPTDSGTTRAANVSISGDQSAITASNVPTNETLIQTTMPNKSQVWTRTFCGNQVFPTVPVPPPGKGRIEVVKTDDGNNLTGKELPVPGINITLSLGVNGPVIQASKTDGSGNTHFDNLQPGTYTVAEVGFQPTWVPVTPPSVTVEVKADQITLARFKNHEVINTPTSTPVTRVTSTNTPVPSTGTPVVLTPTPTPVTPTGTPLPPTSTPVSTSTPVPSPTQTAAPTQTTCCTPEPKPTQNGPSPTPANTIVVPTNTPVATPTTRPAPTSSPTSVPH